MDIVKRELGVEMSSEDAREVFLNDMPNNFDILKNDIKTKRIKVICDGWLKDGKLYKIRNTVKDIHKNSKNEFFIKRQKGVPIKFSSFRSLYTFLEQNCYIIYKEDQNKDNTK